jgi:hypothetical protein
MKYVQLYMTCMCGCITVLCTHVLHIQVRCIVYSSAMLALCYYTCVHVHVRTCTVATVRCIHRIQLHVVLSISEYYI